MVVFWFFFFFVGGVSFWGWRGGGWGFVGEGGGRVRIALSLWVWGGLLWETRGGVLGLGGRRGGGGVGRGCLFQPPGAKACVLERVHSRAWGGGLGGWPASLVGGGWFSFVASGGPCSSERGTVRSGVGGSGFPPPESLLRGGGVFGCPVVGGVELLCCGLCVWSAAGVVCTEQTSRGGLKGVGPFGLLDVGWAVDEGWSGNETCFSGDLRAPISERCSPPCLPLFRDTFPPFL